MNQHVSERDDLRQIGKLGRERGIETPQTRESFADNFELPLNRSPQHVVVQVVVVAPARGEAADPRRSTPGIP